MEIAILPKKTIKIKGKITSIVVDPKEKTGGVSNAAILFDKSYADSEIPLLIMGPGEYEVGGVKVSGTRAENDVVYSILVDGVDILLGKLPVLEKLQHKLKEHNIVLAICDGGAEATFLSSLAENALLLTGENADILGKALSKEAVQVISKFQTTKDKLPQEVETMVLN